MLHFPNRNRFSLPAAIFLFCLLIFCFRLLTCGDNPITWDEPAYIHASMSYVGWFQNVADEWAHGHFTTPFSKQVINQYWQRHSPTPPLAKILNGFGWLLLRTIVGDLASLRSGSVLLYALLFALVVVHANRNWGIPGAIAAALILLINPRLFSHAGSANLDTAGMVLAYVTVFGFWRLSESRSWQAHLFCGVLMGLALAAKNTTFLVLPLLLLWILIYARRAYLFLRFGLMLPTAAIVFFVLWPWLYRDTAAHLNEFTQYAAFNDMMRGVSRILGQGAGDVPVNPRLNRTFGSSNSGLNTGGKMVIPWYYSAAVMGVVLPAPTILLFVAGTGDFLLRRRKDPTLGLVAIFAWGHLALTSLPFIPVYDMERLLLICMPFITLLAAAAVSEIVLFAQKSRWLKSQSAAATCVLGVLTVLYIPSTVEWKRIHPYEFSFFNAFAGGLPGAVEKGFPRTYWLQSHKGALEYLNESLPQGACVVTEAPPVLQAYQEFGMLRADLRACRKAPKNSPRYGWRLEPIDTKTATGLQRLYTFSLEGVPLCSVSVVPPEDPEAAERAEREKRRAWNREQRLKARQSRLENQNEGAKEEGQ